MNLPILLAVGFLFLKTGEKFATQDVAGPTVALLTAHLDAGYEPRIFNDPVKAVEYSTRSKPAAGIVTPGFYLTYAKALGLTPILEVKRQKVPAERYVLVTKEAKKVASVVTPLAAEAGYVQAVILRGEYGDELRLRPALDVEEAVIELVEGGKSAADAVLMEETTWQVIRADPEFGPQLKATFTSDELPGNLVVTFAGGAEAEKLKAALKATPPEVLNSIQVEAFTEIDGARLKKAEERFHGK